jgi:type IV pilus assembly protein PilM
MAATHLALEFTDHEIRAALVVVAQAKTEAEVTDLFTVAVPESPLATGESTEAPGTAPAAAALRTALRRHRVRPRHTTVILPKTQVTTRRVSLPSSEPEEIARMAQFEAERHIPFHPERHIVTHHILRDEGIEGSNVYIAAVDEPVANCVIEVLRGADLSVDVITVTAAVAKTALLLCEGPAIFEQVLALVDIGAQSTDISIFHQGEILFTRSVSGGAKALVAHAGGGEPLSRDLLGEMRMGAEHPDLGRSTLLAQFAARVAGELRRTHEFSRREYQCPPLETVLVMGEGAQVELLAEEIGQLVGLPGRRIDLSRLAGRCAKGVGTGQTLSSHSLCAAAAIVPAPEGAISLNLTPPAHIAQRRATRTRRVAVTTGVLAVLTVLLTIFHLHQSLGVLRESAERYAVELAKLRPQVLDMEDKRLQVRIIRNFVEERNSALAILDFLSGLEYTPPLGHAAENPHVRISIDELVYDRERGTFELNGFARELEDLTVLRQDMRDMGFFTDVPAPERVPFDPRQGRPVIQDFSFKCELLQEELPESATGTGSPSRGGDGERFFGERR